MLIALYQDHHELPWWSGIKNPFAVFDPSKHGDLPFKGEAIVEEINGQRSLTGYETIPFKTTPMFSFLMGLHNVEASHLMAHVSVLCSCQIDEHGYWHYPKRVWVQISTLPDEFTSEGLPIVYDITGKRKPELCHVWGGDNGTYSPYDFFSDQALCSTASRDPRVWSRYFVEQLNLDPKLESAIADFKAAQELVTEMETKLNSARTFHPDKNNYRRVRT